MKATATMEAVELEREAQSVRMLLGLLYLAHTQAYNMREGEVMGKISAAIDDCQAQLASIEIHRAALANA